MASPQERVIELAKSQVGYVPPRGKWNKFAEALDQTDLYNYAKNGYDWCDIFYDWCLVEEFGVELTKEMTNQPSKGCGAGYDWSASYYRAGNQWSIDPSLGAQVFFGDRGDEYHTGMVVGFDGAHVYTVEGNTGYAAGYSGGAVLERTYGRNDSRITGYGVPRWSMAGGHEPVVDVTNVWEDTGELEVDGFLGVQSVTAWQAALGTVTDGFMSSQPWRCYGNTPNLVSVERCYGADGSSLVRAIQRVVGANVDGLMGPQTVRCLQAWLNSHGFDCGAVDGVLGPATAKAVQRSLNAGGVVVMGYGGTERWGRPERHDRQPRRDWVERYPPRRRPSDLAVAAVCVLAIGFLGLCAWAGMALVSPAEKEETELPTNRVTHNSMCATTTYDGELIRWYVMVDPDYQIQYLVNDRGGCCVRLDSDGNVMGVSDEETEEADPYEWE